MARKRRENFKARSTRRSRSAQLSRIFSTKRIAHEALTRQRQSAQHSDLKGFHANAKRTFPTEVSPLLVLASLNAIESAIFRPSIEERIETASDAIMLNNTTEIVHSPRPGPDEAYFALRGHYDSPSLERKSKQTSWDGIEGGHLKGKKREKKSAGRKNESKPKAGLAKPEEKRNDTEEPRFEVQKIVNHYVKNETEIELMVKWAGYSELAPVDERHFQQECPHVLDRYWKSLGTRKKATGVNLFHVFRILQWRIKHTELQFKVQWVGYPLEESTWELAWRVKAFAEEMHTRYLETHPAARNAWEKKNQGRV